MLSELDAQQAERLVEAASDLLLVLDAQGSVLDVRSRDRELQKAARREWQGRLWVDTVTESSREKVALLMRDALADATPAWRQVNHPAGSGPDLPVLYTAVRIAGGARARARTRVVAIGRDLRDTFALQRRLVEAQQTTERDYWRFREAETRYRNLFQASSEAVLIVDGATQRVAEVNPAALSLLLGARAPKPVGAAVASLFAAEGGEALAAALAAARSIGKHDPLALALAGGKLIVTVTATSFRQEQASFLLVRLAPRGTGEAQRALNRAGAGAASGIEGSTPDMLPVAFVRGAADALAFTDGSGRVVAINPAFARLAQLASEEQARGESLDRWLGRTGVELPVLLANLREGGSAGLFTTELRGALGLVTEVEIAASVLEPGGAGEQAAFAFSVRDIGRRLAPGEESLPTKVPASVKQLTELVGRVPLRQIVAETSDLIERLSIETALQMTRDNRAMAAQLLGLSRQSLYVKLRRFGLGDLPGADDG